ncbi:MAG: MerR family transcriptional regulator [Bacteroidetes bacterium]|nr:MerR family transcriptional regulator [Bacteroidota bacterium]
MNTHYSIKELELLSGIKAHTIRIWEQRYGLFHPERTSTNIRQYSSEDLKMLLNISLLNANGFKISKLSKLSEAEIAKETLKILQVNKSVHERMEGLKHAMLTFDEQLFVKIINEESFQDGFEKAMKNLIYPFLNLVGELWQTGAITPLHEHFISALIRQKLLAAIDRLPVPEQNLSKSFVLVCPEGEMHEIGLLYSNYMMRSRGVFTLYLGTNVPADDVVKIWHESGIKNMFLNVIVSNKKLNQFFEILHEGMSTNQNLYLSGTDVDILIPEKRLKNVLHLEKVDNLIELLESKM